MNGYIIGITFAFFKPGEMIMEYEEKTAETIGKMKYGSYVERSGTQRKL